MPAQGADADISYMHQLTEKKKNDSIDKNVEFRLYIQIGGLLRQVS